MPRTRSAKAASTKRPTKEESPSNSVSKYNIEFRQGSTQHVFILPKAATPDARIVTLPHPRHGRPSRYLVCPQSGIHEFTKASAPKSTPSSWLIEQRPSASEFSEDKDCGNHAETISNSDVYIATKIDPLFLMLSSLVDNKINKSPDDKKRLFLSSDDHFDKLPTEDSHLSEILRWDATRALFESRMEAICDTVDAGDEKMFRLSEKKLLNTIIEKAKRMCDGGLPPTMEEKFVQKALEAPVLLSRYVVMPGKSQSKTEDDPKNEAGVSTSLTDSCNSHSTAVTDSNPLLISNSSTATKSLGEETGGEEVAPAAIQLPLEVITLQRLRVAFDFICSRYVPLAVADQLKSQLMQEKQSSIDFTPLETYIKKLAELRAEALATSSVADYSRKRSRDEEQDEDKQQKKLKLEEEKKRKANESRGVRDLKKVNTKGMMKLSHFFKAK